MIRYTFSVPIASMAVCPIITNAWQVSESLVRLAMVGVNPEHSLPERRKSYFSAGRGKCGGFCIHPFGRSVGKVAIRWSLMNSLDAV